MKKLIIAALLSGFTTMGFGFSNVPVITEKGALELRDVTPKQPGEGQGVSSVLVCIERAVSAEEGILECIVEGEFGDQGLSITPYPRGNGI